MMAEAEVCGGQARVRDCLEAGLEPQPNSGPRDLNHILVPPAFLRRNGIS